MATCRRELRRPATVSPCCKARSTTLRPLCLVIESGPVTADVPALTIAVGLLIDAPGNDGLDPCRT